MDVKKSLGAAKIRRVAVVDDDFSSSITTRDLRKTDDQIVDLFADNNDPDLQAYLLCLEEMGVDAQDLTDLASPLAEARIRNGAPERLRIAAENVLRSRAGSAVAVERVISLLTASGVRVIDIDRYSEPVLPEGEKYDLLVVDYYLVDDSVDRTLTFISDVVKNHADQKLPLQVILMSSHEASLRESFKKLRPTAKVSSSRMRVMAKPQSDHELAAWKLTLEQLSADRPHIRAIESFVNAATDAIRNAADIQADMLWGLDLQAIELLHTTALGDNDDFPRYVEECLSRMLLTRIEEAVQLRMSLKGLSDHLVKKEKATGLSSGSEICDSRTSIRDLMTSVVWRGGAQPQLRSARSKAKRPAWVQSVLRFGMVLRDPKGNTWLHLTQSCDLAQSRAVDLPDLTLLFIRGQTGRVANAASAGQSLIQLSGEMTSGSGELITWNLRRIFSPSVAEFGAAFGKGWSVIGELRQDQAQSIVTAYGAQATRIGLQRAVRSWEIEGAAVALKDLIAAQDQDVVAGFPVMGQAIRSSDKQNVFHFEIATHRALQDQFPGQIGDEALRLCTGIVMGKGGRSEGEPYLIYMDTKPIKAVDLRSQVAQNWRNKPANADKVVLAVWPK